MKARFPILLLLLCVAPVAGAARGGRKSGSCPCTTLDVPVSVSGKGGRPVENLTSSDFRVFVDGHRVGIESTKFRRGARRIVLMLEESGSISGEGSGEEWRFALAIASGFAADVRNRDRTSLVTFAGRVREATPFTFGHASLLAALSGLVPLRASSETVHGTTALWDSISFAARRMGRPRLGSAIVVITDGGDKSSKLRPGKVEGELLAAHARLFVFRIYDPSLPPTAWTLGHANSARALAEMAQATGGEMQRPPAGWPEQAPPYPGVPPYVAAAWRAFGGTGQVSALQPLLDTLWGQVREFYELELAVPDGLAKNRACKLRIKGSRGISQDALFYPRKLAPCGAAAESKSRS